MANAIIFTDRAGRAYNGSLRFFNYPAGAYKIASVLRQQGYSVLVVPNCLNYTWKGIKQIIESNSRDLLWVGISTTLMFMKSSQFQNYRQLWSESQDLTVSIDPLFNNLQGFQSPTELVWYTNEMNLIAGWLQDRFQVPLLIGGSWVTYVKEGNLRPLHDNAHIVTGYAEEYMLSFTQQRAADKNYLPPFICSNGDYDDVAFKKSRISWTDTDFVIPSAFLPVEIARGCAFRCDYCNFPKRGIRKNYKDADVLRQELIENYERWGVTRYMIMDDLYNDSKEKVRDLYDNCWSRLPFQPEWTSYMRLDLFYADPESIDIVKASGARIGTFGIETLHDQAGKKVGKGLGKRRILETLENLKQKWGQDVLINSNFIAGLPQEPLDSIQETIDWTLTTDLLFSAQWNPLWVQPPDNIKIVTKEAMDNISTENDKFGIQWLEPQNWINPQGLTYKDVDKLCNQTMKSMPLSMRISWADYADLRTGDLTHEEIAGIRKSNSGPELLSRATGKIISLIDWRLQKVLALNDQ